MSVRLPRIHKPENVTLVAARIWRSDNTKLATLAAGQGVTFSAMFRAVVRAGIAAIEEELSQEPKIIGVTTIGDEDDDGQ
jgi:hypothetical protein